MIKYLFAILMCLSAVTAYSEEAAEKTTTAQNFSGFRELMGIQKNSAASPQQTQEAQSNPAPAPEDASLVNVSDSSASTLINPTPVSAVRSDSMNLIQSGLSKSMKATTQGKQTSMGPDINVESGINQFLFTSWNQFNRIIIPFNNPVIRTTADEERIMLIKDENVVYFATDIFKKPVALFISPKDDPTTTISLSLTSLNIEPKEYRVSINGYQKQQFSIKNPEQQEKAKVFEDNAQSDYLAWIDEVVKEIGTSSAYPELPGYSPAAVSHKYTCVQQEGIDIIPEARWVGMNYQLLKYRAVNTTQMPIEVKEGNCWDERVASVTSYPKPAIMPSGEINLFVLRVLDVVTGSKGVGGGIYAR